MSMRELCNFLSKREAEKVDRTGEFGLDLLSCKVSGMAFMF